MNRGSKVLLVRCTRPIRRTYARRPGHDIYRGRAARLERRWCGYALRAFGMRSPPEILRTALTRARESDLLGLLADSLPNARLDPSNRFSRAGGVNAAVSGCDELERSESEKSERSRPQESPPVRLLL